MSPDFTAKDRIKDSLGYPEGRGVTGTLRYDIPAAAQYEFTITDISHNLTDGSDIVTVNVTNSGNLTDTGQLTMYVDGTRTGDTRHYELNPGQSKAITFTVLAGGHRQSMEIAQLHLHATQAFSTTGNRIYPANNNRKPDASSATGTSAGLSISHTFYYIYYIPRRLHTQATPIMSPY